MQINGDISFICFSLLTHAHFHMKIICIFNRLIKITHIEIQKITTNQLVELWTLPKYMHLQNTCISKD